MDKVKHYREIIQTILSEMIEQLNRRQLDGVERDVIFDTSRDHYMLVKVGWTPRGRLRGATVHVRIRDGKFWIEEDWTEDGIATYLLDAGVPNEDIILGFQPPEMRQYTEFAVA